MNRKQSPSMAEVTRGIVIGVLIGLVMSWFIGLI